MKPVGYKVNLTSALMKFFSFCIGQCNIQRMNYIYLTVSTERAAENKTFYKQILYRLKELDFINNNDHIEATLNIPTAENTDNDNDFYKDSLKRIKKSLILIADVSYPAVSIGTQIEFAISNNIAVLCLCDQEYEKDLSMVLKNYSSSLYTLKVYNKDNIKQVLEEYFNSFRKNKIKFNVFIDNEIYSYLEWYAKSKRMTKSNAFREIVLEKKKNDKNFK